MKHLLPQTPFSGETMRYAVRISAKAKRIILRVNAGTGLEVVSPPGISPEIIAALLSEKRQWIQKALQRVRRASLGHSCRPSLAGPFCFCLFNGEIPVTIELQPSQADSSPTPSLCGSAHLLVIPSQDSETGKEFESNAVKHIQNWIRKQAQSRLFPLLATAAERHGFAYSRASIRFQKTRWGSCSCRGAISLNGYLIFLPMHLVQYVLLHELCHLKHLNHSPRFWEELSRIAPDALACRLELKEAAKYIPHFLRLAG